MNNRTHEAEPSAPALLCTWIGPADVVRLTRIETFSGDKKLYVDVDNCGVVALDGMAALFVVAVVVLL